VRLTRFRGEVGRGRRRIPTSARSMTSARQTATSSCRWSPSGDGASCITCRQTRWRRRHRLSGRGRPRPSSA
jgi:hypothetical protein